MSKKIVALAFAAGLLGGVASRYLAPQPVHADSSPQEIRARRFVLIGDGGTVIGTFSAEASGKAIKLFDSQGQEIWSAGGTGRVSAAVLGK